MTRRLVALLFAVQLCTAATARAQTGSEFKGIDLQLLRPTPFADAGQVTDSALPTYRWSYSAQFVFDYALNPLVWRNADDTLTRAVRDQAYGHLLAHVSLFNWLHVGVALPISLLFVGDDLRGLAPPPTHASLGDLRLALKATLIDQYRFGINLALALDIGFPTGGGQAYLSSSTVSGSPRIIISRRFGQIELALNLGARLRAGGEIFGNLASHQLTANGMIRWNLPWRAGPTSYEVIGELWGLSAAARPFLSREGETVLEWLTSARVGFFDKLYVTAGVGGGFVPGYGSPDFRAVASIGWAPRQTDRDWDGIPDAVDRCPDNPEVYNGIEDQDGCPETDRDGDGIIDILDKCPDERETRNGFQDDDGCPDRKPKTKPKCKPVNTADADPNDEPDEHAEDCAEEPLPPPPPPASRPAGLDRDHDGIPDDEDQCPDQAEVINGKDDDDGCPDEGKGVTVFVSKQKIGILDKINFETASAIIKTESYTILDQVAAQLRAHPEVRKLRIEGHTDSVGADVYNMRLSQARANSVRAYLIDKGKVAPDRLVAVGYGETRPIASNKTPRGKAQNRRVEFLIIEQGEAE